MKTPEETKQLATSILSKIILFERQYQNSEIGLFESAEDTRNEAIQSTYKNCTMPNNWMKCDFQINNKCASINPCNFKSK